MSRTSTPVLLLSLATLCVLFWTQQSTSVAHAQEARGTHARLCRVFEQSIKGNLTYDTSDRTSEIGAWVAEKQVNNWRVADTQLAVGQNANGFPQGWVQVCLTR